MACVDALDAELVEILARRFTYSRAIGELKKSLGMARSDPQRIAQQIASFAAACEATGLSGDMGEKLMGTIIEQVLRERTP